MVLYAFIVVIYLRLLTSLISLPAFSLLLLWDLVWLNGHFFLSFLIVSPFASFRVKLLRGAGVRRSFRVI